MRKEEVLAQLLDKVLLGELEANQALESWPPDHPSDSALFKRAWHSLYHYAIDDDIREREPEYDARQRNALQELVLELRRRV